VFDQHSATHRGWRKAYLWVLECHRLIDPSELRIDLDTMFLIRSSMFLLILGVECDGARFCEGANSKRGSGVEKSAAGETGVTPNEGHAANCKDIRWIDDGGESLQRMLFNLEKIEKQSILSFKRNNLMAAAFPVRTRKTLICAGS